MTGQPLCQRIHNCVVPRRTSCISELHKVMQARFFDIWTFSHTKIQKGYAQCLYHIGFSRNEDSKTSGGFVPGDFGTSSGRKAVHNSFVSPLDPYRPKAQALRSHQELSWSIFCDQLGGGAGFAGFLPNNERECPMLRHNSGRGFLDNEDGSAQFVKDEIEEEESSPSKRRRRGQGKPRKTSWHDVKNIRRCIESCSAGKDLKNSWGYKGNQKSSEVYVHCNYCTKRTRLGAFVLQMWQEAWRIDKVTRKAFESKWRGVPEVFQSLAQLRNVEQVRRG